MQYNVGWTKGQKLEIENILGSKEIWGPELIWWQWKWKRNSRQENVKEELKKLGDYSGSVRGKGRRQNKAIECA